jgi:hypothetical protein
MKTKSLVIVGLVLLATAVKSNALSMNFDSINAQSGAVDATAYLASFGVTLTGNNPVYVIDDRWFYGGGSVAASSPHNFLLQQVGGSPNGVSYTLNFSTALTSLSFTRIAITAPSAVAQWTATAYVGSTAVSSVGESSFGGTEGAQTYTLTGSGITSLTINANGGNFAGISSAPLDDFIGAEVPETGSTLGLLLPSVLALLGAGQLRSLRQRK